MLQNLLNTGIIRGSKALGVDLFISSDGSYDISCVLLNKQKNKISIENKFYGLTQINDITDKSVKGLPVCLSISGKGILYKRVEKNNKQNLIHQILPNAKEPDFFLQELDSSDNFQFVAAIRKEILEPIIDSFKKTGVFITNLYLGPFAFKNIVGIIEVDNFHTNHYAITSANSKLVSIDKNDDLEKENYALGDDYVSGHELQAYTTALGFFIDFSDENLFEKVIESKSEFVYKQMFSLAGWFALAFFFVLLMLNYVFFNKYNDKLNNINFRYNQNLEMIKKLDTLKSEFKIKEQYFVSSGFLDASKLSYFADRIAYTIPKEIQLTTLNINPLDGKIKNDKPLHFLIGKVYITGNVTQSIILNNWVKKLKKLDWINQVTVLDYMQESIENPAVFELEIEIK